MYIMDEPTSGLHFADIEQLLHVLFKLRNAGNTLVIIEHQLDVIKCADYVIGSRPRGRRGRRADRGQGHAGIRRGAAREPYGKVFT